MVTLPVKPWYKSKLVWLGVLEVLSAAVEYSSGLPAGTSIGQALCGILTIVFRVTTAKVLSI